MAQYITVGSSSASPRAWTANETSSVSRIQRYSSYTFTAFAGLHLASTSIIPLIYQSVPYSEPFLLMTREIYQTPLTEPLLVGLPIAAHILSGLALRLVRRSQNLKRYHAGATPGMYALHHHSNNATRIWPEFSYVSLSGCAFVGLLGAHVAMNRILPLVVEGDSSNIGLQYVSHGFAKHGLPAWVAYSLLLGVGCGHMVWGWAKWLGVAPPMGWKPVKTAAEGQLRKRRIRTWWVINGVAVLVTGVWVAGGLGVVARAGAAWGWLGTVYDNVYNVGGRI
jgi:hypothetical protein